MDIDFAAYIISLLPCSLLTEFWFSLGNVVLIFPDSFAAVEGNATQF